MNEINPRDLPIKFMREEGIGLPCSVCGRYPKTLHGVVDLVEYWPEDDPWTENRKHGGPYWYCEDHKRESRIFGPVKL